MAVLVSAASPASAQDAEAVPATRPAGFLRARIEAQLPDVEIPLDMLPPEVEVVRLVEFIADRVGINVIYDPVKLSGAGNVALRIKRFPVRHLFMLLDYVLASKGFALIEREGWFEIVPKAEMAASEPRIVTEPGGPREDEVAVTQFVRLARARVGDIQQTVKSFVSGPATNIQAIPAMNLFIITDRSQNVRRLMQLIDILDSAVPEMRREVIPVINVTVKYLSPQLSQMAEKLGASFFGVGEADTPSQADGLGGTVSRSGGRPGVGIIGPQDKNQLSIFADERTNQLILIGPPHQIGQVKELIAFLDVDRLREDVEIYPIRHVSADEMEDLLRETLSDEAASSDYEEGGVLKIMGMQEVNAVVIRGSPGQQARVARIIAKLDQPAVGIISVLRTYKLRNAQAEDVANTLSETFVGPNLLEEMTSQGRGETEESPFPTGVTGMSPARARREQEAQAGAQEQPALRRATDVEELVRITSDEGTNTVIVYAPAVLQEAIRGLIRELDVRRLQVHIEAKVVQLLSDDDFTLRVQLEGENLGGRTGHLVFSAFGLSTLDAVDTATGARSIVPGLGFSGALIRRSGSVPVLIEALKSLTVSRVLSSPALTVMDNEEGSVESIRQEPFTETSALNTATSAVSFGGYEEAGIKLTATPTISEGNHLRLDFEITVSEFTGDAPSDNVPPPRSDDTIKSVVVIPNGYTVVMSGATRDRRLSTEDKVPFLGDIPFLGMAFRGIGEMKVRQTLYAFIRATILDDERFRDFRGLSGEREGQIGNPWSDFPRSEFEVGLD